MYEYECKECTHKFEKLQKFDAPVPTVCPSCGKEGRVEKAISTNTAFLLMGYGWTKNGMN
jgi:putative FmdB family regulatory protein